MSPWSDYVRVLRAESLKIRRTLALWLVWVLPAAPAGLQLLLQLTGNGRPSAQADPWVWMIYGAMITWTLFVLPLLVALETGLLAGIEHAASGWKHLFALPLRRGPVYAAKITTSAVLVLAAHAMLCLWIFVAGVLLAVLQPDLGFTWIPPMELLLFTAASFAGSWLMLSLHAWIGLRWPSLVLNVGIAVVALVVNLSLVESDLRRFFPWFIPANLTNEMFQQLVEGATARDPGDLTLSLTTSLLGGTLVIAAAVVMLGRRDVH